MPDETVKMWTDQARIINAGLEDVSSKLEETSSRLELTQRMIRSQRILMGIMAAVLLLTGSLALSNRIVFNRVKASTNIIKSCTTPGQKCYEQNADAGAAAVKSLNDEAQRQHNEILNAIELAHGKAPTHDTSPKG